ncbi:MAG: glycoside hydrolase family 25 protein [Oscillospiraceae bacterium]|nr:glycoside hydrolase family 25 protein [Oscillospiraceae bacterium]
MNDLMDKTTSQSKNNLPIKAAVPVFGAMLAIILCLSVTVIVLAVNLGGKKDDEAEEPTVTEAYVPIVNTRVYDFYSEGDYVYFDDPYYGSVWLPAFTDVPRHTYDYSGLVLKNGRYIYSEDGVQISRTGIDVSYHQGDIDWERVAADGIDFVMLRLGYRGYESGALNVDGRFHEYAKGASDAGLDIGVYFYSQALNTEEAIEEANFVMENIRGYDITFPVVFDWEVVEDAAARTNDIEPFTVTECAAAFCDTVSDGGYTPMVYGSGKYALFKLNMSKLANYDFWFAEYKDGHTEPNFPYNYTIWQYASDGTVDGIEGDVDLNICFADYGRTAVAAE